MWQDPAAKARLEAAYFTRLQDLSPGVMKSNIEREALLWGPLINELGVRND